ncbi:acyl-CoA dehydrogenase [Streptomyces albidoflavus]|uniref:acyl-CoA dehydrogenase family protein n=1 Tax=Streptomyces albidoflavus TaxID=1886 RepID=UPI002B1CD88B|nr:acyl-CoA dehydrogenase [Streptomyces albidoflavus]
MTHGQLGPIHDSLATVTLQSVITEREIPLRHGSTCASASAADNLLFATRGEEHLRWRELFSTEEFGHRDLPHRERVELSYRRLRTVAAAIPDPRALALSAPALTALHEWAGPADPGMATLASIHYNLFLGSLLDHDHAERDLEPWLRMDRIGTFLCTEAEHGNDAVNMETTAEYDRASRQFVLNTPGPGAAKWMPNTSLTGGPKDAVVAARLLVDGRDLGIFLFLTPLSDERGHLPGVSVERLPHTSGAPVDHCATRFHHVRLPHSAMLQGDHGRLSPDGEFESTLGSPRIRFLRSIGRVSMGKLCMSGYSLGATRQAVAVAVRHGSTRLTSGMTKGRRVPLMAHRSHHEPLLDALATTYAATLLHRSVVRQWEVAEEAEREEVDRLVAVTKGWITWAARETMTTCRERCGAKGLLLTQGIAGQLAANEGTITAEGDNQVIWVKAAGELLMGGFTPKPPSETAPEQRSLRDGTHLQDLMADVERIWHERARTRLRTGGVRGNPMARWNGAVTPALELVAAHAHRLAGEALLEGSDRVSGDEAERIRDLHRLFALRQVAAHSGELLAGERLTAEQVRRLPDEVERVVADLEPHALALTERFFVPEQVPGSDPAGLVETAGLVEAAPESVAGAVPAGAESRTGGLRESEPDAT